MSMQTAVQMQATIKPTFTLGTSGLLQRACACGQHISSDGGECEECKKKRQSMLQHSAMNNPPVNEMQPNIYELRHSHSQLFDAQTNDFRKPHFEHDFSQAAVRHSGIPFKAWGVLPEQHDEAKPSPYQGSATIQCNGSGGYEIMYGNWGGATCGTKGCVTAHENSHMADWQAKWPTGCQGKPKGYLPKGDPPDNPLMTPTEYQKFLKESECKAHTVDLACAEALPILPACKATVEDYVKLTREQKAHWCPSLSRGGKVGVGIGSGLLIGAGIGALAGGPLGAAIGAGVGALVGGIAGFLL